VNHYATADPEIAGRIIEWLMDGLIDLTVSEGSCPGIEINKLIRKIKDM